MNKKVAVFTSTRADYGILYWLLKDLSIDESILLKIIVSGSHLDRKYGETYHEIEDDGFDIDEKIPLIHKSDTRLGIIDSLSDGIKGYGKALTKMSPDILVVLGDRYEVLGVSQAAYILKIPILHLHGGEVTEGAYDDGFRHAITKLSYFHCVATAEYRKRVIQLGENPDRVFNTGALGIEHIMRSKIKNIDELNKQFEFNFSTPYFLITYHPETLSIRSSLQDMKILISSLENFPEFNLIITYPNSDHGSDEIIEYLKYYQSKNINRVFVVKSFGHKFYNSVVKYSEIVIGNSSSGIIEAPAFNVPTINIGERQKGRIRADSVIDSKLSIRSINESIDKAFSFIKSEDFSIYKNPYGSGDVSKKIINIIKNNNIKDTKKFYDIRGV